ncbi:hypothetical protein ALT717_10383 [Alteromonas macleodii]|jgi:excisionase family DNA binding protein|uniref:helix-turn-helix transcriptional regulator n=1 Tax=Alteromonas genovensis TaxID=471225 RepID=UPI002FE364FF
MSNSNQRLLTTKQAAEYLGLSYVTLNQWRNRERGPSFIQYEQGGPVRYSTEDLDAYVESRKVRIVA